jgi:phosphate-selective porin OprO/OprP
MKLRLVLLTGAVFACSALPALADEASLSKRLDQMQKMIETQQLQIETQKKEINALLGKKGIKPADIAPEPVAAPAPPPPAINPVVETRLQQQDQKVDDLINKFAAQEDRSRIATQEQAQASVANGRLQISSADGRFTAALRLTGQFDVADYMQGNKARALGLGPDLSSGANFRRMQVGLQGKLFGDWSYYVNIDSGSGGSTGTEAPGHIQQAYVEYDGLAPFTFRIGAHPPSTSLDDSYAATDQLLLERSAPGDTTRNMAGGDGRDSIELLYLGDSFFGSLALTGDKVQETTLLFDEQQALVARIADVVYSNADWRFVVSLGSTDVFRPGDSTAALNSARPFSISNPPEIIVDDNSTKFVSVSDANVTDAWDWNLEAAATYDNLLAQGGYFKYGIDQRGVTTLRGQGFSGWYAEGSWVLTGEARGWAASTGSFTSPKPRENFSLAGGGWGAFELAGRYSDLNLNDNVGLVGATTPAGGIRGGEQRIGTLGLNWYPNTALKFTLQAQNTQINHINAAAPFGSQDQNFNTLAFRTQVAF